jgi:hypothetical protein
MKSFALGKTCPLTKLLTYEILEVLNTKMHGTGLFCDLAKDFDCVNRRFLLTKLPYYGTDVKAGVAIKSDLIMLVKIGTN